MRIQDNRPFQIIKYLLIGCVCVAACWLISGITSNAAGNETQGFPYIIDEANTQYNSYFENTDILQFVLNNGDVQNYINGRDFLIYVQNDNFDTSYIRLEIVCNPYIDNTDFSYSTNWDIQTFRIYSDDINFYIIDLSQSGYSFSGWGFPSGAGSVQICGAQNTINFTDDNGRTGTVTVKYPVYSNIDIYYNNDEPVITRTRTLITGHAQPYNPFVDLANPTYSQIISNVPPVAPSWDSSLSVGENLKNYLVYIAESINNGISTIINNIKQQFDNLIQNLYSFISGIIETLNRGFQNFANNMIAFFEPILNAIKDGILTIVGGLTHIYQALDSIVETLQSFFTPFDSETFEEDWQDFELGQLIDELGDELDDFEAVFSHAEERNHYTFYLSTFGTDLPLIEAELSFDWLIPVRPYVRGYLWAVFFFEVFVNISSSIGNFIHGLTGGGADK